MFSYFSVGPRQRLSRMGLARGAQKPGLGLPPARGLRSSSDSDLERQAREQRIFALNPRVFPHGETLARGAKPRARIRMRFGSRLSEIRKRGEDHVSGRQPEEQNCTPNQTGRHLQSPLAVPTRGREHAFPGANPRRDLLPYESESPRSHRFCRRPRSAEQQARNGFPIYFQRCGGGETEREIRAFRPPIVAKRRAAHGRPLASFRTEAAIRPRPPPYPESRAARRRRRACAPPAGSTRRGDARPAGGPSWYRRCRPG